MAKTTKTLELHYPLIQFLEISIIKNWLIGKCNSRVFIGSAMYYTMLCEYGKHTGDFFWAFLLFILVQFSIFLGRF